MANPIVRNELRMLRKDPGYWLAIALLGAFFAYGFYTGFLWLAEARSQHDTFLQAAREARTELVQGLTNAEPGKESSVRGAMPYAPRSAAALPPSQFLALSVGQADMLPSTGTVSLFATPESVMNAVNIRNPAALFQGHFDAAFVLVFLFPLAILAVCFNVLSAEREQGTLTLALANPISVARLLFSRLWVRSAAVVLPAIAFVIAGLLITGWPLGEDAGAKLALSSLAIVAYAAVWISLVALVNTTRWSSSTNAIVLGALWLFLAIVGPGLLALSGELLYPLPPRGELVNEARLVLVEADKQGDRVMGDLLQLHPELKGPASGNTVVDKGTLEYYAVIQQAVAKQRPRREAFQAALDQRESFINGLSLLSPPVSFRSALNRLAGTGPDRFRRFEKQTMAHLEAIKETLAPRMFLGPLLSPADYEKLPAFSFEEEPTSSLAAAVLNPFVLFAAIAILIFVIAARRARSFAIAN